MNRLYSYTIFEPVGDGINWCADGMGFMSVPTEDLEHLLGEVPDVFCQTLARGKTTLYEADINIAEEGMILYDANLGEFTEEEAQEWADNNYYYEFEEKHQFCYVDEEENDYE